MSEVLRVITESGTYYDFCDNMTRVRRTAVSPSGALRRDGEWLAAQSLGVGIGKPMMLTLEPLGNCIETRRYTTPVVSIETVEDC